MTLQDLTAIDAARAASGSNFFLELFNYIGGWDVVGPLLLCLVLAFVLFMQWPGYVWAFLRYVTFAPLRERWAMDRKRDQEERELVADFVTDALEQAYNRQQITFETKKSLYTRIGKLGYPDLLSRGEQTLKEEIQKRRADPNTYPRNPDGSVKETRFPGHAEENDRVVVVLL